MSRKQASSETCKRPFASRLSAVMDERGITQKQLAEVIGKKPQTVSLYKLGQSEPDASTILIIADYLNVTVDWLIGRDNAPMVYGSTVSEAAAALGLDDKSAESLLALKRRIYDWPCVVDLVLQSEHFAEIVKNIRDSALYAPGRGMPTLQHMMQKLRGEKATVPAVDWDMAFKCYANEAAGALFKETSNALYNIMEGKENADNP